MPNGRGLGGRFRAPAGGRGRMPGGFGLGPGGSCRCPSCGYTSNHPIATPCYDMKCPNCGNTLVRA